MARRILHQTDGADQHGRLAAWLDLNRTHAIIGRSVRDDLSETIYPRRSVRPERLVVPSTSAQLPRTGLFVTYRRCLLTLTQHEVATHHEFSKTARFRVPFEVSAELAR